MTSLSNQPELPLRIAVLFLAGVVFSLLFSTLLIQREVTSLPTELLNDMVSSAWWVPIAAGILSLCVGMLYPTVDSIYGTKPVLQCDWSNLIRCSIIFFGINHACMKLDYMNSMQLSVTLGVLSITMWWLFDRTVSGLVVGLVSTIVFISVSQFFVYHGFASYKAPDFFLLRSWIPSLIFSAVITFGTIGRQLSAFRFTHSHED
ncbi:insulin-induced gene 2 protein-like [Bolinopsis microptera]|uniref:insulin-induced gene 2 protein-like n=1 Tax=Bolinopsis microptera TaxID=2820187 RepID=UPI00307A833C